MTWKIEHFDKINNTPALPIAVEGLDYLLRHKLTQPVLSLGWDQSAILATDSLGYPVGVITWTVEDWKNEATIALGYVRRPYRKSGVYWALWNALVVVTKERKLRSIVAVTATDNIDMRETANRLGRREIGVYLSYDLTDAQL